MDGIISNGFEKTLREVRNGSALTELTEKLQELVMAVAGTGKGGILSLKIKIKPASVGNGNAQILEDEISVKLPKLDQATTIMFAADDGTLQRNDPRQKEFELRAVKAPEVKTEDLRRVASA